MPQMIPRTSNNFAAHLSCYSCFFFFFILSSSSSFSSHAVSTLTQGQSLADGETLVSAGAVFELGIFRPDNSTLRYLGIWYHPNISADQTVVWVANRASPIRGSGSRLTVSIYGDLLLLDEANTTIWSTEAAPASNASTTARIEDNGNLLLLQDAGGGTLWQSFDHPTDTFLPGMKVGVNASTGRPQLFTAWQSTVDPSPGNYSMGLDPDGSTQIIIWAGSGAKRWRSGQWNGHKFIGTVMRALFVYGFNYDNEAKYFTYTPHNNSLLRFVMGWSGAETTWMLVAETRQWKVVWGQPSDECQVYGRCGDYGSCSYAGDVPTCSCLPGFVPRSTAEWSSGDWKGGCVRRTPLACQLNSSNSSKNNSNNGGADGFFKMVGAKLPDYADWFTIGSEQGCRRACLSNCSCKAYAFGASDVGCMMWGRDLIDIYQSSEFDYDLNIKLSASELEADMHAASNKKRLWRVIVTVTTLGSALVLLSCFFLCWKYNARLKARSKRRRLQDNILPSAQLSGEVISEFSCSSMYGEENQKGIGSELPLYTFECIGIATNYFSDSNKLGEGGFGYVYKGTLPGGQEVAIKRLSRSSGQGLEEFKNEVILISKLQHRNLVRLLGCCIKGEEKILIYEYLPNKSLDAILFDPSKKHLLDWKTRFNIIDGIARGLVYLHRDSRLRIVHRDLKASNILLDEIMNPKISDFGMAKIFGGDQNQGNTNRVVGTFGYMSPEYAMEGFFSVRSDVYSFGVLVLEIVTGQRNSSFYRMENGVSIIGHAWQMWSEGRAAELVDPSIRASSEMCQVLGCIHVALLCVQDRASDRPDVDSVISMITSEAGVLPMPRQPKFVAEGSPSVTATTVEECGSFSTSDVSMTLPQGR